MDAKRMVTKQEVEKEKMNILFQKIQDDSYALASGLNPHVESYFLGLSKRLDKFIFENMKRARNGFGDRPLYEQLQEISAIRVKIEEIAELNEPNHRFIGVARELAENTFYRVYDIYKPFLNPQVSVH